MTMKLFALLILAVFASEKENAANGSGNGKNNGKNPIVVKIEEDEYVKVNKKSRYTGVSYTKNNSKWLAQRRNENKNFSNGYYDDEVTAALASDTLARKFMRNSERKLKLNFPGDDTEVYPEQKKSKYIGVTMTLKYSKWKAQRWSKHEQKMVSNGYYDDEETAAHASDTLARKLVKSGEQKLKLNFPDDDTEVYADKSSKFIGVSYNKNNSKWRVQRKSKHENKNVSNGYYDDEETAAHASDTLARKLMENGGLNYKLNFPDEHTEFYSEDNQNKKRKRPKE